MLDGVMFHGEQTDVFEFLNYKGFAEMHRKRTFEEYKNFRDMRDFLISTKNTIPDIFYSATKMQVKPQERKKYTKDSFDKYLSWENYALEKYKKIYSELVSAGDITLANKVNEIICETSNELSDLTRLYIELENTEYGAHHLERIQ